MAELSLEDRISRLSEEHKLLEAQRRARLKGSNPYKRLSQKIIKVEMDLHYYRKQKRQQDDALKRAEIERLVG